MTEVQSPEEMVLLDTDQWVRQSEYDRVIDAVTAFIPSMLPKHSYSLETMVGQRMWRKYSKQRMGSIVAHAVRRRLLPLRFADNGRRATKQYELDD